MSVTLATVQTGSATPSASYTPNIVNMNQDRPGGTADSPFIVADTDEPMVATIPSLSIRTQVQAQARPSSSRRQSTPLSSRSNRVNNSASQLKKKPEEKRVLPVRMRGLGGSSGTGSNITGKDVEDMIYQCFSRTLHASKQPTEDLSICLTTSPYETIRPTLNRRAYNKPEPDWWTSPLPDPASILVSPTSSRKIALPSPSPGKKRRLSGLDVGEITPMVNGRKKVVMPGFRKVIEEDDVVPNEKRKTRGAATTTELEDDSDAHYQTLHLRYERYESRARLAERQKMEHGRYKLSIRIEYLEGLSDEVWEGAVMRMMQRGKRVRPVEEPKNGGDEENTDRNGDQAEGSERKKPEIKSLETLQAEEEERTYMAVMDAGAALLDVLTIPGLKRELVREGKELLARYDRVLTKPKPERIPVSVPPLPVQQQKVEKRARSRSSSRESTMTPPPPETEEEIAARRAMLSSARKRSASPEIIDARKPPSKRAVQSHNSTHPAPTVSSRPTRSTRAQPTLPPYSPSASAPVNPVFMPYIEPYYPPTTESGKPALVEATERRFVALQNAEKLQEMQAKQKESGKGGQAGDSMRSGRRSRTGTMLPFGVAPPRMLGWKMDFDLDGDFWRPLLTERGYGDAIDPPDFLPFGLAHFATGARAEAEVQVGQGEGTGSDTIEIAKPDVTRWVGQTMMAVDPLDPTRAGNPDPAEPGMSLQMEMEVDVKVNGKEKVDPIHVIDVDDDEDEDEQGRNGMEVIDVDEGVEAAVEDVI
ncbi:hypothetical protein FFLO_02858 [Filobasidium floriforme]|uniref:Something about silencing protein 4 domain-containing protein n=1 Tax=Filobasidium floriforme TaxID=5210 RepID=A0A8K0JS45_9TREE|nr:uncharacterized protein HD553DRAFT_334056 [Filobasidium floriforme]KAG7558205.1 hypothetical protein FFLO_02858 [Filobasidium floriforme]KAH8088527.1 hypothetical protein HD553DRAFT_334056 [Filobasidium floriforme]